MPKKKMKRDKSTEVIGTPTMLLLPSRNYKFKVSNTQYSVRLPRCGKYSDLDSKLFSDKDGDFDVLLHDDKYNADVVLLPNISKLMFVTSQYPDMKDNQAFAPVALIIHEDYVDVVGNLIEMMEV